MRLLPTLFAALALIPAAAAAQPIGPVAEVVVRLDDELLNRRQVIGEREARILTEALRQAVAAKVGAPTTGGGRLELTIEDARPNRPTQTELAARPGLSAIHSFGVGGAEVTGVYIAPDGRRTPLNYRWYGNDAFMAQAYSEWHEANVAFRRFAQRLAG